MNIDPINQYNPTFSGIEKKTELGNTYQATYTGKAIGFTTGACLSGCIINSQLKSLDTFGGRRNLIESFKDEGKSLNDIITKTLEYDKDGNIIPTVSKISNRAHKIVNRFKTHLAVCGTGLTLLGIGIGHMVDVNNNLLRARKADDKIFAKSLER